MPKNMIKNIVMAGVIIGFLAIAYIGTQNVLNYYYIKQAYKAIVAGNNQNLKKFTSASIINEYITIKPGVESTLLIQAIIHKPDDASMHNIIKELLSIPGIDPNKPEKLIVNNKIALGRRPIHWAVERGNVQAVKLLIEAQADITIVDPTTNLSPLAFVQSEKDLALREEWHLDEIEKLLKNT